jgi:hypothetical protein
MDPHGTSSSKWDCFANANVVDDSKTIVTPGTASSQRRNHTVGAIPHPPPLFFYSKLDFLFHHDFVLIQNPKIKSVKIIKFSP